MITLASLFIPIGTFHKFRLMFCTNKTFLQTYANMASHDPRTTAQSISVRHPPYSESGVYSSCPTYTDAKFSNKGPSRFFVNMLLSFYLPGIHFTFKTPASFISRRKHCCTSMWLVLLPTLQLLARSIAPWLLHFIIIGSFTFNPIDSSMFCAYIISCTQSTAA